MQDLTKVSTKDLICEGTFLEQELSLKLMRYNMICTEILRRYPLDELKEVFEKKDLEEVKKLILERGL